MTLIVRFVVTTKGELARLLCSNSIRVEYRNFRGGISGSNLSTLDKQVCSAHIIL